MAANPLRKLGCLGLFTLTVLACADDRLRAESRAFLSMYESIEHRSSVAVRELKLKGLEALVLTQPEVQAARSECVAAHRALLSSEKEHETAAKQLDEALAKTTDGTALPPETTARIKLGIDHADQSLSSARSLFERCENQARSLSLRFGKH